MNARCVAYCIFLMGITLGLAGCETSSLTVDTMDGGSADGDADADADSDTDTDPGFDIFADGGLDGAVPFCDKGTYTMGVDRPSADIVISVNDEDVLDPLYDENAAVAANLSGFYTTLSNAGIDPALTVIAAGAFCGTEPLNSTNCLDLSRTLSGVDLVEEPIDQYSSWKDSRRVNASLHFVFISDNKVYSTSKGHFEDWLVALDPPAADVTVNVLIPYTECDVAVVDDVSNRYQTLADANGGVKADLCVDNAAGFFTDLADKVLSYKPEAVCGWAIPDPPAGKDKSPSGFNVLWVDSARSIYPGVYVEGADSCTGFEYEWYVDDLGSPTTIHACPAACDWVNGQVNGAIGVGYIC